MQIPLNGSPSRAAGDAGVQEALVPAAASGSVCMTRAGRWPAGYSRVGVWPFPGCLPACPIWHGMGFLAVLAADSFRFYCCVIFLF